MGKYNPQTIEKKWQKEWLKSGIHKTQDRARGKKNFYLLVMFPYPSGDLHIGHWFNFALADVFARFKRMRGLNVLSPMGFDAFGLPAENAAIKHGIHPKDWTYQNIERMREQLKSIGAVYDWSREIITSEPEYYKWTQWMFLQFYKAGLVYRSKAPANFCTSCKTVLANEQVTDGKCFRCDSEVVQKEIEQWLFKISAYAEDLLKDLDSLDWPETTKIMQRNWIGKSAGWQIKFPISNSQFSIPVFTTRPDTLFGCTYLVVAPEHEILSKLSAKISNFKFVEQYIQKSKRKTERERISEVREKSGIELRGVKAVNPANGREMPIFAADYVLMHYGTGAIMAVPAHDNRDWDFAKKYNLPIIQVISGPETEKAYEGEGILINSGRFNGLESGIAKERIGEWLGKQGRGEKAVYYRLKDWIISRQRYWGAPIPLVFCENCAVKIKNQKSKIKNFHNGELLNPGWIEVPAKELPVLLPAVKDYLPTGQGQSPLAKSAEFVNTVCPKCKLPAQRETDTMDTFVCSSWYFLRYVDPENKKQFASQEKIRAWLPVNTYIGGAEHTCLHLLYSRFFTKVLNELGYLDFKEPFLSLRHQGIVLGPDGQKMSKSRGNVVDPDQQIKKYGADTVRAYLCFMGPYSQGGPWNPRGMVGVSRFLNKVWDLVNLKRKAQSAKLRIKNHNLEKLLHKTIKKVTEDIENLRFNTAVSALMILINEIQKGTFLLRHGEIKTLLLLLAPFVPHLAEELWQRMGGKFSIHNQSWPKYDEELVKEKNVQLLIQINGRVRDRAEVQSDIAEYEAKELVLKREKTRKWLAGKEIKKVIFLPGKLINFVV